MDAIPEMISIREVAQRTNLSDRFIRKLCKEDRITYVMSGRKYLINWQKFLQFLNKD